MADHIDNATSAPPARLGVVPRQLAPELWGDSRRLDTPELTALLVDYDREFAVAGEWCSGDVHYFDMSLSSRPVTSRGCFSDRSNEYQRLGRVFFAPAGHRLRAEGRAGAQRTLYVFLRADPRFPDELGLGPELAPVLRHCLSVRSGVVGAVLQRISQEVSEPDFASALLVESLGLTALGETARLLKSLKANNAHVGGLPPRRLKIIEDRVRCGDRAPTVSELAELCGLSRRQLTRAFREETGQTLSSFVQALTIDQAKSLLTDTDEPIRNIAAKVGFASAAAFSTAFLRATGRSPRNFRRDRG